MVDSKPMKDVLPQSTASGCRYDRPLNSDDASVKYRVEIGISSTLMAKCAAWTRTSVSENKAVRIAHERNGLEECRL